ncbi:MAG TPA: hypothetical protein VGA99_13565 [bacterium]
MKGSNPRIDYALTMIEPIRNFLKQDVADETTWDDTLAQLDELLASHPFKN